MGSTTLKIVNWQPHEMEETIFSVAIKDVPPREEFANGVAFNPNREVLKKEELVCNTGFLEKLNHSFTIFLYWDQDPHSNRGYMQSSQGMDNNYYHSHILKLGVAFSGPENRLHDVIEMTKIKVKLVDTEEIWVMEVGKLGGVSVHQQNPTPQLPPEYLGIVQGRSQFISFKYGVDETKVWTSPFAKGRKTDAYLDIHVVKRKQPQIELI